MPTTKRTAEAASIESIGEDIRAIREDGGVRHADDEAFLATVAMLDPGQPVGEDNRRMAENLILTHVRRVSVVAREKGASDPCQMATVRSFETILSRPLDDTRLVAAIRRAAKAEYECSIGLDALRKREDSLLDALARAVHEDLLAAAEARGPQTMEEMARYIIEDVKDCWEDIDDGLRRVYRVAPMTDQQSRNSIVLSMLYDVAHMQYWAGRLIGIRMRVQQHSRVDFLFGDIAAIIMTQGFPTHGDKEIVAELLTSAGRYNKRGFLNSLLDHENGQEIFRRFSDWAAGCHLECAYQRTYNHGLLCAAHQLAFALYMFLDVHEDLLSGELEDDLRDEFNQ